MRNVFGITFMALAFTILFSGVANAYTYIETNVNGTVKNFNEIKTEDCSNVDKVVIISTFANVNVSASNTTKAEAHLSGEAILNGELKFDVRAINRELRITVRSTGNCFNGNLRLDIIIPQKTFEVIYIKGASADVTVDQNVTTNNLEVQTQSGDVESYATINHKVSTSTMSGDVELYVVATESIGVEANTMSGDVSLMFNNIGHLNISVSSMSGDIRNLYHHGNGFEAYVNVSTMSGDITIR